MAGAQRPWPCRVLLLAEDDGALVDLAAHLVTLQHAVVVLLVRLAQQLVLLVGF